MPGDDGEEESEGVATAAHPPWLVEAVVQVQLVLRDHHGPALLLTVVAVAVLHHPLAHPGVGDGDVGAVGAGVQQGVAAVAAVRGEGGAGALALVRHFDISKPPQLVSLARQ